MEVVKPTGCLVLVGLGLRSFGMDTTVQGSRDIDLRGSRGSTAAQYREVLKMLADGKLSPLLEEVSFSELSEAIARLERGDIEGRLFMRLNA